MITTIRVPLHVIVVPLCLLFACGLSNTPDQKAPAVPGTPSNAADTLAYRLDDLRQSFYDAQPFDLDDTIRVDLTGDGTPDQAVFVREKEKAGIVITDGRTRKQTKIGLGHPFEPMTDDFSWVDYWGLVRDTSTYEIVVSEGEILGDTIVRLEHPAIVLRRDEVGGGLIVYRNGRFVWVHQAD